MVEERVFNRIAVMRADRKVSRRELAETAVVSRNIAGIKVK